MKERQILEDERFARELQKQEELELSRQREAERKRLQEQEKIRLQKLKEQQLKQERENELRRQRMKIELEEADYAFAQRLQEQQERELKEQVERVERERILKEKRERERLVRIEAERLEREIECGIEPGESEVEGPIFIRPQVQEQEEPLVDGMRLQIEWLLSFVGDYIKKTQVNNAGLRQINASELAKYIEPKAKDLGLDLRFAPEKSYGLFEKVYVINGVNRVSGYKICTININNVGRQGQHVGVANYNANIQIGDGCIKSGEDGRLFFNRPLETYFFKNGSNVNIVKEQKFVTMDKNSYKIVQYPGLYQSVNGQCGFYAINNIAVAYNGIKDLKDILDRTRFELLMGHFVSLRPEPASPVSNLEIIKIINTDPNFSGMRNKNVMVSLEEINRQNVFSPGKFNLIAGGGTPQERIRDFRVNGTPQYLIISTGDRDSNNQINGITLNWDNRNNRRYCLDTHWIAIKIEWQDIKKPGKSPVVISIFDSGPTDSRYAVLIHWYYYMFVHSKI